MKKYFAAILAGVILSSLAGTVSAHTDGISYGDVPMAEAGSITIDGEFNEAEWKGALAITCDNLLMGDATNTTRGTAYLKWDADNLYVYFDVQDKDVAEVISGYQDWYMWNVDSVEIMLDFTNEASQDLFQYRVDYTDWASVQANNPATESYIGEDATTYIGAHVAKMTDTGYAVEMRIDAKSRGFTLTEGMQIGFFANINEMITAEDGTQWACVANWSPATSLGTAVWTPEKYDYITLAAAPVEEPDDTPSDTPITADAGIVAAAAVMAIAAGVVLSKKR